MSFLPAVGTFSYNGFTWNGSTKSKVHGKPLYDGADRSVVSMVYTLSASSVIQNAGGITATMLDIRQKLSKPGQQLIYTGNGFGDLSINIGGARDAAWGPKPRVISFRPLGSSQAWELEWECEVCVPECPSAVYQNAPMAFNYEVDYRIDADGYTTRVISGYLEIPMTRVAGGSLLPDCVDAYYERIVPAIPAGFRRVDRSRKISSDKRRLEFSIVDEQIPGGGFPPGITDFDGSHSVASGQKGGYGQYVSSLSASYTVAPGTPRSVASDHFFAMLLDRSGPAKATGSRIVATFRTMEGLGKSRRVQFECSWTYCADIVSCMELGGLFRPVPNTNWQQWITSLGVATAQSPRGFAGMQLLASDDAIVDLCLNTSVLRSRGGGQVESRLTSRPTQINDNNGIDPNYSWMNYSCWLEFDGSPGTSRLKSLPSGKPPIQGLGNQDVGPKVAVLQQRPFLNAPPQNALQANLQGNGRLANQMATPVSDTIQQRCTPTYKVALCGYAVRAQYKIPLPMLASIAGVPPVPSHQWAEVDKVIANWSGVPMYSRQWRLEYDLDKLPTDADIVTPGNPAVFIGNS